MFRNRKSVFRPRLEALESRWCPACDVRVIGSALFITGDAADNDVFISDESSGVVFVECDGEVSEFNQPIHHVLVRSGNGNDFVGVSWIADGETSARSWTLDLGNGNDTALIFDEGILDAPVFITVNGGAGADDLSVQTAAMINSTSVVTVIGGNDADSIFNFYSGPLNGTMVASSFGGAGDDVISEEFAAFRINGTFAGLVDGGAGVDLLSATLGTYIEFDPSLPLIVSGFDVAASGRANYLMSGGDGHDALLTSFVGAVDGQLNLVADGGSDSDDFFVDLDIHAESTGRFSAQFRGGSGDDNMEVRVRFFETEPVEIFPGIFLPGLTGFTNAPAPLAALQVVANGGRGFDTCLHSDFVTLIGIEDDQPL